MKKKNTVTLNLDAKHASEEKALGEVLEDAIKTLSRNFKWSKTQRNWLARLALRSVCEHIIKTGQLPIPLEIQFVTQSSKKRAAAKAKRQRDRRLKAFPVWCLN